MGALALGSIAIGVVVGVFSTCIQSIGLTLQRQSHTLEITKDSGYQRPPYLRRRWQIGMLLFLIANIFGSTIQITTLPLPVLSALQATGLVFNSACATILLAEPFTRLSLVGTVLVTAGAVLIATFGAIAEPSHTLDQLLVLLGGQQFLAWMFFTFALVTVILAGSWSLSVAYARVNQNPARINLLRGICFGAASGILSAHTLLVAKTAVELLVRTIVKGDNQFHRWQSWVILGGLVTLALSQLYFLHEGLKLMSTSVLYPFVFCVYNVIAILDGLIYFQQTSRLPLTHGLFIAAGTAILLAGVLALSWRLEEPGSEYSRFARRHSRIISSDIIGNDIENSFEDDLVPGHGRALSLGLRRVYGDSEDDSDDDGNDEETIFDASSEHTPLLTSRQSTAVPRKSSHPHSVSGRSYGTPRRSSTGISHDNDAVWNELNDDSAASLRPVRHARTLPLSQKLGITKLHHGPPPRTPLRTRRFRHSPSGSHVSLSLLPQALKTQIEPSRTEHDAPHDDSLVMRDISHNAPAA